MSRQSSKELTSSTKRTRQKSKHYGVNESDENYDEIFDRGAKKNSSIASTSRNGKVSQNSINSRDISVITLDRSVSLSAVQLLPTIAKMSATINHLKERIDHLNSEMRRMNNNTKFQAGDREVTADEMPLLKQFESFELPIHEQTRLDNLEHTLKTNKTFYIFFVSA